MSDIASTSLAPATASVESSDMFNEDALLTIRPIVAAADLPVMPSEWSALNAKIKQTLIVGRERDGEILLVRDFVDADDVTRTLIELHDTRTSTTTVLYTHFEAIHIVSSSVNAERTLVAFTTVSIPPGELPCYESFLVEIRPQSQRYEFNIKSRAYQCIQFVHSEVRAHRSHFFFVLDRKRIELYVIATQEKSGSPGAIEISSLPSLQTPFVKSFLWYSWDPIRATLYYLTKENKTDLRPSSSSMLQSKDDSLCVLQRVCIGDRKAKPVDYTLSIKIQDNHVNWPVFPAWSIADSTAPALTMHITPVPIGESGLCLCVQHPRAIDEADKNIDMTVFVTHTNMRAQISIQLNSFEKDQVNRVRVVCSRVADLLMLYVPGEYLAFLDCGATADDTRAALVCNESFKIVTDIYAGPQFVPFLSSYAPHAPMAAPFDLPTTEGTGILDCRNAVVYDVQFARKALLSIIRAQLVRDYPTVIHIAAVNLQDRPLVNEIMSVIFLEFPQHVSADIVKELLVAKTYREVRRDLEQHILRLVPMSCIVNPQTASRGITWSSTGILVEAAKLTPPTTVRRFPSCSASIVGSSSGSPSSPLPAPAQIVVEETWSPIGKFFGFDKKKDDQVPRSEYEEKFIRHIMSAHPKEDKKKCISQARILRAAHTSVTEEVFECIMKHKSVSMRQQLLLHLYSACEELEYPLPAQFNEKLADVAFQVMPRHVLRQFMDMGVIQVSDDKIRDSIPMLGARPDDVDFKYDLVSHASTRKEYVKLLHSIPEAQPYLLQHYLSQIEAPTLPTSQTWSSNSLKENAEFIPSDLVLAALHHMRERVTLNATPDYMKTPAQSSQSSTRSTDASFVARPDPAAMCTAAIQLWKKVVPGSGIMTGPTQFSQAAVAMNDEIAGGSEA